MLLLLVTCMCACSKSNDDVTPTNTKNVTLMQASDVSETSFTAAWNISTTDVSTAFLKLSFNNNFEVLEKNIEISNLSQTTMLVEDLKGARKYYIKLEVKYDDGTTKSSAIQYVNTAYTTENATFTTSDNMTIAASIGYMSSIESAKPAVIFMHEFGSYNDYWPSSDIFHELISEGYVCMRIFFRGHGTSTPLDDLTILLDDFGLVAKDLSAAITFIQAHAEVDPDKLALVGASMGGIMAIAGNGYSEVKASVSISSIREGIYALFPNMTIHSALFIAGELDARDNYDCAADATFMHSISDDPKKLIIVPENALHGTMLLSPDLDDEIVDWIRTRVEQ